jgi:hypothetical protein
MDIEGAGPMTPSTGDIRAPAIMPGCPAWVEVITDRR